MNNQKLKIMRLKMMKQKMKIHPLKQTQECFDSPQSMIEFNNEKSFTVLSFKAESFFPIIALVVFAFFMQRLICEVQVLSRSMISLNQQMKSVEQLLKSVLAEKSLRVRNCSD